MYNDIISKIIFRVTINKLYYIIYIKKKFKEITTMVSQDDLVEYTTKKISFY
jgi:hypothetical protein